MSNEDIFTIKVNIGILLAQHVNNKNYKRPKITIQLTQKMTLRQLVQKIGIPEENIGFIVVDGKKCDWNKILDSDAYVILVPYIVGG